MHGQGTLVLKGLDPIDLIAGKEVAGNPQLHADYLRHRYHFSSVAHLNAFKKAPEKYAVQNGGACGKMGALTGKGSPARFAVAKGKIFLFASDGCRETFLANQEQYFAPAFKRPNSTAAQRSEASQLLQQIRAAHGGSALDSAKVIEWDRTTPYSENGVNKIWHTKHAYLGPDKFAQWEEAEGVKAFFVSDGKNKAEGKPGEVFGIHTSEYREFKALFARHPVGILKGSGSEPVAPLPGGRGLTMANGDIVFEVVIDPATKLIEQVQFKDIYIGPVRFVTTRYSDYKSVSGVQLPSAFAVRLDSGEIGPTRQVTYTVNGEMPPVFRQAAEH